VHTKITPGTDARGNTTATYSAVDSNGNNLANTISPIFDKEKVRDELEAQIAITQAFDQAQQQFRMEINKKVDEAKSERDSIANSLKNQDVSEEQRMSLINQGLNAQKEIEQFESVGLIFSAVAGGLSAPTGSIGGIVANSLAPQAANQIGQSFKDHGTEGGAAHVLAHGVLAGAVAALGGNNPMGAALSAMGGEIAAPLVADLLYGKPSEALNAEQKATVSAIASLGGIAVGISVDSGVNNIAQANLSAQNAVDNNWGEVGHYSTMATVLYLAGFSPKDAKAVALAAWGPDTDKRNVITVPNYNNGTDPSQPQIADHMLDGEKDPAKVIAVQQKLAEQVGVILRTIKQFENDPATKALYLSQPVVQQVLHSFGDSFAHVQDDGTHYAPELGHAKNGTEPDNPYENADAYKSYVNALLEQLHMQQSLPV
jgi:filamentous hemagglutinin